MTATAKTARTSKLTATLTNEQRMPCYASITDHYLHELLGGVI